MMSYDLDEILINAEKDKIFNAKLKIQELRTVMNIFSVEEKYVRREIESVINRYIKIENDKLQAADNVIIAHFREVIG